MRRRAGLFSAGFPGAVKMYDASWLFGNEELSDAQVVLVEEEAGDSGGGAAGAHVEPAPKHPRTRTRTRASSAAAAAATAAEGLVLPIHKAIVMSASEFFKARFDTWQEGDDSGEPCRVLLHVPPGQLELGRRLVRAMYEFEPSLGDLSTEQQLQLVRLADRYGAPKLVAAAIKAVGIDTTVASDEALALAVVHATYPPDGSQVPTPVLRPYADAALQQLFGDLEAVWASADASDKQGNLLALPHAALKALLANDRTRVASENTVVHTIEEWVDKNDVAPGSAQVKELLALVRVARLTPHYARTVLCESALSKGHLSAKQLALTAVLPLVGEGVACKLDGDHGNDEGEDGDNSSANWRLPARPRSALADALQLEWRLPLSELEACVASRVAAGEGTSSLYGPEGAVWQGWPLQLTMECHRSASSGLTLGFFLVTEAPSSTAGAVIKFALEAVAASGSRNRKLGPTSGMFLGSTGWGLGDFFDLDDAGPPTDWAGVEAALRAARLVHGGGGGGDASAHLKLRCRISELQ